MATDFATWLKLKQSQIETALEKALPPAHQPPEKLHQAMRYSTLGGGKRVRALLCYAVAEFCHTPPHTADAVACAVELIHAYSLVHDDMPCMDDDDLRRGKPSCHKQYDEATALLVGDALQSLAFTLLSRPQPNMEAGQQLQLVALLAQATGSNGMAGGQAIDLDAVGKPLTLAELTTMHRLKTGALIQAAVLMGASHGSPAQIKAVTQYAHCMGLAFQVVDDILDSEADTETLGKTAGKDAKSNKPTYVTLLGLTQAKQHAEQLYTEAMTAIAPFDNETIRLRELADFIMQRRF